MRDPGRVMEVLDAALSATEVDRPTILEERCDGDVELRSEVEKLLALEDDTDGFLATAARGWIADEGVETTERFGPYRLLDPLGHGGMGSVYLAVREDHFEKKVALKVLRRELAQPDMIRRFHAERQILAHLEHPSISRLLDGGTAEDGRPYLVMEYVDGVAIDEYCTSGSLGLRERLELFVLVCQGVAYAHQNLIVHRDLKPHNILVTADGSPKLLDFGIAKLLEPSKDEAALTAPTVRMMTPRYASPEQVLGETVNTASDVYSLGLLLFELLAGKLPCELSTCPPEEVSRRVCTAQPEPPSRSWRRLPHDIDVIVAKALCKEPSNRYLSVLLLALDVENHLNGRPVRARHGNLLYRGGKLARRRPWAVAAVALFAVMSFVSTFFWREAVAERRRADDERQRADAARVVAVLERERAKEVSRATARALEDLASALQQQDESGELCREALAIRRQLLEGGPVVEHGPATVPPIRRPR